MAKKVYVVLTVDGDLRVGNLLQRERGIQAMREVFARAGILGSTTWFINEFDFQWTTLHASNLLEIYDSGDELAVHDHQDSHHVTDYSQALGMMRLTKNKLEDFFRHHHRHVNLVSHRNGCAVQNADFYRALKQLDYRIVSDVWPGNTWAGRMVKDGVHPAPWRCLPADDPDAIRMDNSAIPLTALPWRHDAENWMDYHSRQGHFLQLPITTMPWIDSQRVTAAVDHSPEIAIIVTDTHPYDLQDIHTGEVSQERCEAYFDAIHWLKNEYNSCFIQAQKVVEII